MFSYIKLLEDEELRALLLLIDSRVMRECTFYTEWAPPDCLKHAVAPEGSSEIIFDEEVYIWRLLDSEGVPCGDCFRRLPDLQTHQRSSKKFNHGILKVIGLITPSYKCINCETIFPQSPRRSTTPFLALGCGPLHRQPYSTSL